MGNKSQIGVALLTEKEFYLPGEIVQGNVYVNSPKAYACSKIMLYIQGKEQSWFMDANENRHNPKNQSMSSNGSLKPIQPNYNKQKVIKKISNGEQSGENKILEAAFVLMEWDSKAYLHGQYSFPFVFQLPSYIPGSFH